MTGGKFSKPYAREELTAEMGAALLLGKAGFLENPIVENSAAYLRGWIENLKADPRCLAVACGKAQKAADWILGNREAESESEPEEERIAA
jgi:antirestriction protein ArdC